MVSSSCLALLLQRLADSSDYVNHGLDLFPLISLLVLSRFFKTSPDQLQR